LFSRRDRLGASNLQLLWARMGSGRSQDQTKTRHGSIIEKRTALVALGQKAARNEVRMFPRLIGVSHATGRPGEMQTNTHIAKAEAHRLYGRSGRGHRWTRHTASVPHTPIEWGQTKPM
ncbi:unnamed protein product, partial [Ectocarpus sp. 12 AP-2014]